ncbi:MAG: DUF6644 family protein [Pseudomonadota bacterium]|nr:DUF6644 family protein [Pseudomonadota bacterium]
MSASAFDGFLEQLSNMPFALAISGGAYWFPILETVHVLAIALVVGTIAIVDLRLLGVAAHRGSADRLIAELLPYTWVAFVLAVIAGALLFASNAPTYAHNLAFQLKAGLIVLAGLNMAAFHLTTYRRIAHWDEAQSPPTAARVAGATSLCLWVVVVFLGRWVGFTLT